MAAMAQRLFDRALSNTRDPRSDAYREGVLYILRRRIDGVKREQCSYDAGSAECDAWIAGTVEGHQIARTYEAGVAFPRTPLFTVRSKFKRTWSFSKHHRFFGANSPARGAKPQ